MHFRPDMEMKTIVTLLLMGFYGSTTSTSYSIRTHFYVAQELSWTEAQQYCRLYHDDLSTLSSLQENDCLLEPKTALCTEQTNAECRYGRWIGLYTDNAKTELTGWKWSGQQDIQFSMWAKEEPHTSGKQNCAYYDSRKGEWYSASCSLNLTFFCMEESPQLILVKSNKTWEEALDYCRSKYTDLASLRSDEENDWAVRKSQTTETAHVWTGLHYVVKYWIWVDGHALEYKAWSQKGHYKCPAKNLRCGTLETETKTWMPRDCEEKLNFLCLRK